MTDGFLQSRCPKPMLATLVFLKPSSTNSLACLVQQHSACISVAACASITPGFFGPHAICIIRVESTFQLSAFEEEVHVFPRHKKRKPVSFHDDLPTNNNDSNTLKSKTESATGTALETGACCLEGCGCLASLGFCLLLIIAGIGLAANQLMQPGHAAGPLSPGHEIP